MAPPAFLANRHPDLALFLDAEPMPAFGVVSARIDGSQAQLVAQTRPLLGMQALAGTMRKGWCRHQDGEKQPREGSRQRRRSGPRRVQDSGSRAHPAIVDLDARSRSRGGRNAM